MTIDIDALERLANASQERWPDSPRLSSELVLALDPATIFALITSAREAERLRERVVELEREMVRRYERILDLEGAWNEAHALGVSQGRAAERAAVMALAKRKATSLRIARSERMIGGANALDSFAVELERGEHIDGDGKK